MENRFAASMRVCRAQTVASDFYATGGSFMDSETGSEWNFDGCAIQGKRTGACLKPLNALKDYWFDWRNYHPATTIFKR